MSSSHDVHDIKKEVRGYLIVFGALLFFTVVTVGVSYLHLSLPQAITLALIIATIKAGLVASYFMHLISEKVLIYIVLLMAAGAVICMVLLFLAGYYDPIRGTQFVH